MKFLSLDGSPGIAIPGLQHTKYRTPRTIPGSGGLLTLRGTRSSIPGMHPTDLLYQWILPAMLVGGGYFVYQYYFWGNLRISVRGGKVEVTGQALAPKAVLVRNFWEEQLAEVTTAWLQGHWDGRRLRLRCSRSLSPCHEKRIRTYLLTIL